MSPKEILAVSVLVFGTLTGAALLITSSQGRGIDDSTAYAAFAGAFACVAASIGVALTWPWKRKDKNADNENEE